MLYSKSNEKILQYSWSLPNGYSLLFERLFGLAPFLELIRARKCFTHHAPRQSGKTTSDEHVRGSQDVS